MLGDWIGDNNSQNMGEFFQIFGGLSATVIGLTYFYNILGQWIG